MDIMCFSCFKRFHENDILFNVGNEVPILFCEDCYRTRLPEIKEFKQEYKEKLERMLRKEPIDGEI